MANRWRFPRTVNSSRLAIKRVLSGPCSALTVLQMMSHFHYRPLRGLRLIPAQRVASKSDITLLFATSSGNSAFSSEESVRLWVFGFFSNWHIICSIILVAVEINYKTKFSSVHIRSMSSIVLFLAGKWCPRREWSSPTDARAASDAARRGVLYSSVFLGSPGEYTR